MIFDKIFFYIRNSKQVFDEKISARKLVKKKFWYEKGSEELFVILPPWGGRFYLNFFLRKKILKRGCSFLEYEFPEAILSSSWETTVEDFNRIRDNINKEIEKLKKRYKFKKINLVGISIGCINTCMIANNNSIIDKICLIVPGRCLAESMWKGISTQKIRQAYEKNGINLKKLKEYWRSLAPENNINKLKAKEISIFLSKADVIIPFHCGKKLVEEIKAFKYNIFYKNNKFLGHNLTALSFYLRPERFLFNERER
jgi:predicted esterase